MFYVFYVFYVLAILMWMPSLSGLKEKIFTQNAKKMWFDQKIVEYEVANVKIYIKMYLLT